MTDDDRHDHREPRSELPGLRRRRLAGFRQWCFPRPFRIPAPDWPAPLLLAVERALMGQPIAPVSAQPAASADADFYKLIAELATGIWRIRRKFEAAKNDDGTELLRSMGRYLESTWDSLQAGGVEVRDDTGERYVAGMALHVLAFQPMPGCKQDRIHETIKPSIYYKDKLIQRGEVIVTTPERKTESSTAAATSTDEELAEEQARAPSDEPAGEQPPAETETGDAPPETPSQPEEQPQE